MSKTFDQSLDEIARLVKYYSANRITFRDPSTLEADARQNLIDPLFVALDWDVHNTEGAALKYRPVMFEESREIEGTRKAPDYTFRIGGEAKFFAEAKKPRVSIENDRDPAYQLRRYGWSARLPLSLLTDFEELAVYDCRITPQAGDTARTARLNFYTFDQYPDHWRAIWDLFSFPAVRNGSFDQYVSTKLTKRGVIPVDTQILKDIENWRLLLARNMALRNRALSTDDLNDAVIKTIDRILFLRIAEDRGIEPYERLLKATQRENIYPELVRLFRLADAKYNSGLFDFSRNGDRLTPTLTVDGAVLKEIITHLYVPRSAYAFQVIPVEILGNVYEQFLGKVIHLTPAHQARIEEKPEVRKAGGVYYTPSYIVDYIVKHTVGRALENQTPKRLDRFRVLDMACGSGSFLLGAYQYLLDWYLKWYTDNDPAKHKKAVHHNGSEWRLTTAERKRILTAHIFGVDIDRQAVEVTKLSLLLQVLEGESQETLQPTLEGLGERALPNLDANIKCGNSLIAPDYFDAQILPDSEELKRVNPFDWSREFPDAMRDGGFDCIIGNPPYIRIQTMKEWAPLEVELYKELYQSAGLGNYDIYVVFVEKGLGLLNDLGHLGFILPHKFFNAQYGAPLRTLIGDGRHLRHVVHFGDQQVFQGATTYTCLLFLDKRAQTDIDYVKVIDLQEWRETNDAPRRMIRSELATVGEWNFAVGDLAAVIEKLAKMPVKLKDTAKRIYQGLVTGADPVFILENRKNGMFFSHATGKDEYIEPSIMHPLCKGSVNVRRYLIDDVNKSILFPYSLVEGKAELLTSNQLANRFPRAWEYLRSNKSLLESREHGKWNNDRWYAFGRSQNLSEMEQPKLLTPSIANRSSFVFDRTGTYYFIGSGGGGGGGYGIVLDDKQKISYEYHLGLLNSRLLDIYLKSTSSQFSHGYYAYNRQYIEQLPISPIDFSDPADVARHDRMVVLVEQMLALHKHLSAASSDAERAVLQRQIDTTDAQIDALVYELYDLTPAEIKIVQSA